MRKRLILLLALALGGASAWAQAVAPAKERSATTASPSVPVTAAPAAKVKLAGLPNLGKVGDRLYRGGQPEKEGYEELKKLGVQVVVNFRQSSEQDNDAEQARVEGLGMRYVEIPWRGLDDPSNAQIAEFLRLLKDNPDKTIFYHCRRGAERTGVMTAAYRMAFQRWTPEQALAEMEEFKFRGFWFRHLKRYVRSFPEQLQSDPHLQLLSPK
jgi:protein tyrosine phosphatase (PTP) superfamily phosphohydrolase (DUF442 family)